MNPKEVSVPPGNTSLAIHPSEKEDPTSRLLTEISETESIMIQRRADLRILREELLAFKMRYARLVGSRLSEIEEVEKLIKEAERQVLGVQFTEKDTVAEPQGNNSTQTSTTASLKKLFWSVARRFHPDYAGSDVEALRRHAVMAEANRAYSEGDFESLKNLLDDGELRSVCLNGNQTELNLAEQLWSLKDEIRTLEFGIKRIKQDALYKLKISVEEHASSGRDVLKEMTAELDRKLAKARRRLEHFS